MDKYLIKAGPSAGAIGSFIGKLPSGKIGLKVEVKPPYNRTRLRNITLWFEENQVQQL